MQNPNIAICQFKISDNKEHNVLKAKKYISDASKRGADIIILPECFICPYDVNVFKNNAEKIYKPDDPSCIAYRMLIGESKIYPNVYIFGGSIIEEDKNGKLYNTCIVTHNGSVIGKYRKNHLYKINLSNHSFCEGTVLTPGTEQTIISTIYGKVGIGICYDLRFPNLAEHYMKHGCFLIVYPGSFNRVTGPKHWMLLQQARALDNQLYVASCSSACSFGTKYESYGKSFIISPFGEVKAETSLDSEEIVMKTLDLPEMIEVRKRLPILNISQ